MEYLDQNYIDLVNKSYSKQFSKNQYIVKILPEYLKKEDVILDFGAGSDALGTKILKSQGYDITAFDIGRNSISGIHDPDALNKRYSIIICSNVLNIQPTEKDVELLLILISNLLKPDGKIFCNLPRKPRYNGYTKNRLELKLKEIFSIKLISKDPPVWMCWFQCALLFKCDDCGKEFYKNDNGNSLSPCPFCNGESHYTEYFEINPAYNRIAKERLRLNEQLQGI